MLITIDPGHGKTGNPYPAAPGFYEGTQMWYLAQYMERELVKYGFKVLNTRPKIEDNPTVNNRGLMAAQNKSAMLLSLHSNACGKESVRRTEIYYSIKGPQFAAFAGNLCECVGLMMGHQVRAVKTYPSAQNPGMDYYGVIRSAANNGCTCAFIIEHGFHTNKIDAGFLTSSSNLERLAVAEAKIIAEHFNAAPSPTPIPPAPSPAPSPAPAAERSILSAPTATAEQAKAWAEERGAAKTFVSLADIYWNEAQKAGVNPVAAYCQSAKETAYGNFGNVLTDGFCNPCGMKTSAGGSDTEESAHQRFADWNEGIRAHIDHLALYAGAFGYPKSAEDTPDPRHMSYLFGRSKTIEGLGGLWAPSLSYGKEIVIMMNSLEQSEDKSKQKAIELTIQNALEDGVITDGDYWRRALAGARSANPEYIKAIMDRYHNMLRGIKR